MILPVELAWARVERSKADSDVAVFHDLLYAGELVLKLTVAGFLAMLEDDRDKHRYRLYHKLVRADGIGEWTSALDDALTGPASPHLISSALEDRRAFTERLSKDAWQYDAVEKLNLVLKRIDPTAQRLGSKAQARAWFASFSELRNKTRAHGAPTAAICSDCAPILEESIRLICNNLPLFKYPWAYFHRNLSGRYRIVDMGGDQRPFSPFKSNEALKLEHLPNGVYLYADKPRPVELLQSNADVTDFFFPNGAFNGKRYELHSLLTDSRLEGDATPYLASPVDQPNSETHGLGKLDVIRKVFTNIPAVPLGYVPRPKLEGEIRSLLVDDRHPVVTLVGRGGIGKTSLALKILHDIADTERFDVIVWFSARDIDLSSHGPKLVNHTS